MSSVNSGHSVQNKDKVVYFICTGTVSFFKECNIKWHYEEHYKEKYDFQDQSQGSYESAEWNIKICNLFRCILF